MRPSRTSHLRPAPRFSGLDLAALVLNSLDISGADWSSSDAAGILGSVDVTSGVTSLVTALLAVGNQTYAPTVTTDFTGPRWYQPLTDSNGVPLTSDDHFIHVLQIKHVAPVSSPPMRAILGVCEDPTATALTSIKLGGACLAFAAAGGNPILESVTVAAASAIGANANNRVLRAVGIFRPSVLPSYYVVGYDASGVNRGTVHQASSTSFSASAPLYRCFAWGAYNASSTWTAGLDAKMELSDVVIRLSPDPSAS